MKPFYAPLLIFLTLVLLLATACGPVTPQPQTFKLTQPAPTSPASAASQTPLPSRPAGDLAPQNSPAASQPAVLLFGIGMHIEPLGASVSELAGGSARPDGAKLGGGKRRPDYNQPQAFERGVQDIQAVAQIIEDHAGRLTIQAQTPFSRLDSQAGSAVLAELAANGHEIGLHFHEDAHLGKNSENLPPETWCAVMKEEIDLIQKASNGVQIRYWSGGNLYPQLYTAAACAGLDINSDWKNPATQSTPLELTGVQPWRPAGGTDGQDFTAFVQHDPQGNIIFLPEGQYERTDFASMRRSQSPGGDQAYFDFLAQSLRDSLAAAQAGQVNVFHFTIHPGEFRGDPAQPFAVIERFLSEVVDPLVASGQVRWATFSEMADAYRAWEANPAQVMTAPESRTNPPARTGPTTEENSAGYISFIINTHDWTHPSESADTLLRLVDLFEQYGVRGEFYFTAPTVEQYAVQRPDAIERLKNSQMTISYHIRPPHPLYPGFDDSLKQMSDAEVELTLRDYETYALDLSTGGLDRSRPGGYNYVASVFGRKPVVVSTNNSDRRLRGIAERVYASLGARMTLHYHEQGTSPQDPFVFSNGLLVRPSDFSVTRVTAIDGSQDFWWNRMSAPEASRYAPTAILESGLADWQRQNADRLPLITALIHENNFYRSGQTGWFSIYHSGTTGGRASRLQPPYNLDAPDLSVLRTPADQQAIWQAYSNLVAYAAQNLEVVTSEDILKLAGSARQASR